MPPKTKTQKKKPTPSKQDTAPHSDDDIDVDFNPSDYMPVNGNNGDIIDVDTTNYTKQSVTTVPGQEMMTTEDGEEIPKSLTQDVHDLFRLAVHGDALALEELFERSQIHPDTQDAAGHTSLLIASRYGSIDAMRVLIKEGANPLHYTQNGNSAFMLAAAAGQLSSLRFLFEEVVPALLPSDLQILLVNKNFDTVLMFALMAGQLQCVQYLFYIALSVGVLGVENQHYLPPGKGNTVQSLNLDNSNTISSKKNKYNNFNSFDDSDMWLHPLSLFYLNRDGLTPLMCACECENVEVVELLSKALQFVADGKTIDDIEELFDPKVLILPQDDDLITSNSNNDDCITPQQQQQQQQHDDIDTDNNTTSTTTFQLCNDDLDREWLFHHLVNIYLDDCNGDEYDEADVKAKYDTTQLPPKDTYNTTAVSLTKSLSKPNKIKFIKKYINHRDVNGNTSLHVSCRDLYLPPPQQAGINQATGQKQTMGEVLAQYKAAQLNGALIATTLISLGGDCSIHNHCYETPYEITIKHFATNTNLSYKTLIDQKVQLNSGSKKGKNHSNDNYQSNIDFSSEHLPTLLKMMRVRMDEKQKEADNSLLELLSSTKDKKNKKDNKNKTANNNTKEKTKQQQQQQQPPQTSSQPHDTQSIAQTEIPDPVDSATPDIEIKKEDEKRPDPPTTTKKPKELKKEEKPTAKKDNKKDDALKKDDTVKNDDALKKDDLATGPVKKEEPKEPVTVSFNAQPIEEDDGQGWVKVGAKKSTKQQDREKDENRKSNTPSTITTITTKDSTKENDIKKDEKQKITNKEQEKLKVETKPQQPTPATSTSAQSSNTSLASNQQLTTPTTAVPTTTPTTTTTPIAKTIWGKPAIPQSNEVQPTILPTLPEPEPSKLQPDQPKESSSPNPVLSLPVTPQPSLQQPQRLSGTQHPRRLTQIIHEDYPISHELALGAAHVLGQGLSTLSSEQLDCVYSILMSLSQRVQDEQRTRLEEENRELSNQLSEAEVSIAILQDKVLRFEQMMGLMQQQQQQQQQQQHQQTLPPQQQQQQQQTKRNKD